MSPSDNGERHGWAACPAPGEKRVMESTLSGRWYSARPDALREEILSLLPKPAPAPESGICAALVPHAGYRYSGSVAMQVLCRLDPRAYDRVVVLAPSHYLAMPNQLSVPEATHIRTPLGDAAVDTAFIRRLQALSGVVCEPHAHDREHSVQIQVPLLQVLFGEGLRIVPVVTGQMSAASVRAFARHFTPLLDARTLVLVSSDFTHYGPDFEYVPFVEEVPRQIEALDRRVFDAFAAGDLEGYWQVLESTGATVCGRVPLGILTSALPRGAQVQVVAYDTSGRMLEDWHNSVSYFGALVRGQWSGGDEGAASGPRLTDEDRAQLLRLARATLSKCVQTGDLPSIDEAGVVLTPGVEQTMGAFVTLLVDGELRGSIGEVFPRRALWAVVREHAANAALNDPRFDPVSPREVGEVRIEIAALTTPRPVSSYHDIVLGRHGMVMNVNGRTAVFLPHIPTEQGWNLETTLAKLSRKAGLHSDAWRGKAEFMVFETESFHES